MEQQSFAVSSSTGRGVGPLTHVGGPQNCGQADESPHPSILLVGAGSIATATRKCLARGGLGEDWGQVLFACGSYAGTKCWFHSYCKCNFRVS